MLIDCWARRAAILTAVPALLVVLTACGSPQLTTIKGTVAPAGMAGTDAPATATATPAASASIGNDAPATSAWPGTTQFMEVKGARRRDGVRYLDVRPAEKKKAGKSVATVSLGGAWTEVALSDKAVNAPLRGDEGSAAQFVALLAERSAAEVKKGLDLSFDEQGNVVKMAWPYVSVQERAKATIAGWAGSTQFLQIKDARKRDGITTLRVRPAEQQSLGESFDTVTIGGPWYEVVMSPLADNVPMQTEIGGDDQLIELLGIRIAREADEGFNITFDQASQVTKITWLYVNQGH
jgi:hypothetical protein